MPLGPNAPTQDQFATSLGIASDGSDIAGDDSWALRAASDDQMIQLPSGTVPSYRTCTSATTFEDGVTVARGLAFCLWEKSAHRMVGVTVPTSAAHTATLNVVVWQHT